MLVVGIISYYCRFDEFPVRYSLGSLRLAAKLSSIENISVSLFPVNCDHFGEGDVLQLMDDINAKNIDILGLPLYSWTVEISIMIRRMIKKHTTVKRIVLGGPSAINYNPDEWLADEHIIVGEGEIFLAEYCQKTLSDYFAVPHRNKDYSECENYSISDVFDDTRPLYSTEMIDKLKIGKLDDFVWYETMRGCMYRCAYCGHKSRSDVSGFSLMFLEEEIKNIGSLKTKRVFIVDPILGGTKDRGKEILRLFTKYAPDTAITFYLRLETLDDEYIEAIKEANVYEMRIGIQTLNKNVPQFIRNNSLEKINKAVKILKEHKIPWRAELIVGLPGDTIEGFMYTLKCVSDEIKPTFLYAYHLSIIDGTPISELVNKKSEASSKLWINKDAKNRASSCTTYSCEELKKMLIIGNAFTSFYNRNAYRMVRGTVNASPSFDEILEIIKPVIENIDYVSMDEIDGYTYVELESMWNKYEFRLNS